MKILLISNSFGVNLQTYAFEIAKLNGLDLHIYTLFIGGCPLKSHDNNIKENKKDYELFIDGKTTGKFVSVNEALKMEKWDYVSLQQASHVSGDISSYYPYFNNVYAYVKKECPDSKIMFHQTWAYSGKNPFKYSEVPNWLPTFTFKNDVEMKNAIDEALDKISKDYKIDLLANSGDIVFDAMTQFDDVYDECGFHLNELGCYLIGLNLVKILLNKPIEVMYKPAEIDENLCKKSINFINRYINNISKINIKGRYTQHGDALRLYNGGTTLSFNAKGKTLSFKIKSEKNPGYYCIIEDFDYQNKKKFRILANKTTSCTYPLKDEKVHHIDIIKVNEAIHDYLLIKNIDVDGEIFEEEKPTKLIKAYGDSSIAGYGILSHAGIADYDSSDATESFCFRAIYPLNVDYDIVSGSGWGLVFSAYTNPKETGVEKYRDCVCVNCDEKWVSKKADLLIISLGTNDISYMYENREKSIDFPGIFEKSYENFIKKERENNPDLPVLMIYGSLNEEQAYELVENTYKRVSKSLGNIYLKKIPGDNTGIDNHAFVSHHKVMAEILKEEINKIIR